MEAFHIDTAYLAVIGKGFGSTGLENLLVESIVAALGLVQAVLGGWHCNLGVRVYKIIWEAVLLTLETFLGLPGQW